MKKPIIAAIVLGSIITNVFVPLALQTPAQPASATQSAIFDHSQCQYPQRSTNPPEGCDNSDPCDTSDAVKGGSGECASGTESSKLPAKELRVNKSVQGGACN